jgi:hypothetical protein
MHRFTIALLSGLSLLSVLPLAKALEVITIELPIDTSLEQSANPASTRQLINPAWYVDPGTKQNILITNLRYYTSEQGYGGASSVVLLIDVDNPSNSTIYTDKFYPINLRQPTSLSYILPHKNLAEARIQASGASSTGEIFGLRWEIPLNAPDFETIPFHGVVIPQGGKEITLPDIKANQTLVETIYESKGMTKYAILSDTATNKAGKFVSFNYGIYDFSKENIYQPKYDKKRIAGSATPIGTAIDFQSEGSVYFNYGQGDPSFFNNGTSMACHLESGECPDIYEGQYQLTCPKLDTEYSEPVTISIFPENKAVLSNGKSKQTVYARDAHYPITSIELVQNTSFLSGTECNGSLLSHDNCLLVIREDDIACLSSTNLINYLHDKGHPLGQSVREVTFGTTATLQDGRFAIPLTYGDGSQNHPLQTVIYLNPEERKELFQRAFN